MAKASKTTTSQPAGGEYKCLAKIRFDGTVYEVGDAITPSVEEVQNLLLVKAIEPTKKTSSASENE